MLFDPFVEFLDPPLGLLPCLPRKLSGKLERFLRCLHQALRVLGAAFGDFSVPLSLLGIDGQFEFLGRFRPRNA